jgi:hypothetical protein
MGKMAVAEMVISTDAANGAGQEQKLTFGHDKFEVLFNI